MITQIYKAFRTKFLINITNYEENVDFYNSFNTEMTKNGIEVLKDYTLNYLIHLDI